VDTVRRSDDEAALRRADSSDLTEVVAGDKPEVRIRGLREARLMGVPLSPFCLGYKLSNLLIRKSQPDNGWFILSN